MTMKLYKPTTPGRRKTSVIRIKEISRVLPYKNLVARIPKSSGRNFQGKITVRHKGGGGKKMYRILDFEQDRFDVAAKVETIEYDPNRNALISRICYKDGVRSYILTVDGLKIGDKIVSSQKEAEIKLGNRLLLKHIPAGVVVSNIELFPGKGGSIARSAGMGAQVMSADAGYVQLRLPSGEIRMLPAESMATIGSVSNPEHRALRIGKAGRMRHMGVRPSVRGKAMNPVDHPHGGGEGVQGIGLKGPKTPWGKYALGVKTRPKYKKSDRFIVQRRKKK